MQFYFRNESLADAGGSFGDLIIGEVDAPLIDGRAGDAFGARDIRPAILNATAIAQPVDSFTVSFWIKGNDLHEILRIGQGDGVLFRAFYNANSHRIGNTNISAGDTEIIYDGKVKKIVK